jgi:hypothetical protein
MAIHKYCVRCDKPAAGTHAAQHGSRAIVGAMANDAETDYDALARRYLDLWQSQLSALSSDQQLTETMARLLATTNASMAAAFETARRAHADARHATDAAAGTTTAAAAPDDRAAELGELRARLDALERRIAELESRPRRRTPRPRAAAAKPADPPA